MPRMLEYPYWILKYFFVEYVREISSVNWTLEISLVTNLGHSYNYNYNYIIKKLHGYNLRNWNKTLRSLSSEKLY